MHSLKYLTEDYYDYLISLLAEVQINRWLEHIMLKYLSSQIFVTVKSINFYRDKISEVEETFSLETFNQRECDKAEFCSLLVDFP